MCSISADKRAPVTFSLKNKVLAEYQVLSRYLIIPRCSHTFPERAAQVPAQCPRAQARGAKARGASAARSTEQPSVNHVFIAANGHFRAAITIFNRWFVKGHS